MPKPYSLRAPINAPLATLAAGAPVTVSAMLAAGCLRPSYPAAPRAPLTTDQRAGRAPTPTRNARNGSPLGYLRLHYAGTTTTGETLLRLA